MGTAVDRASAVSEMRQKAEGYGIPNNCVDGMNPLYVREVSEKAIELIRSGNGPYFLEVETYRFRGHSMGDPERYRQQEEVKKWQENDPIGIYRNILLNENIASESELDLLDTKVDEEVREAIQFAENSPEPQPEELFKDIYVEE